MELSLIYIDKSLVKELFGRIFCVDIFVFFGLSEEMKKMDQKTKLKPGCPKSKVNITKNKGSDNSLLERVVKDDKDSSIENGIKTVQKSEQGINKRLLNYKN